MRKVGGRVRRGLSVDGPASEIGIWLAHNKPPKRIDRPFPTMLFVIPTQPHRINGSDFPTNLEDCDEVMLSLANMVNASMNTTRSTAPMTSNIASDGNVKPLEPQSQLQPNGFNLWPSSFPAARGHDGGEGRQLGRICACKAGFRWH